MTIKDLITQLELHPSDMEIVINDDGQNYTQQRLIRNFMKEYSWGLDLCDPEDKKAKEYLSILPKSLYL